MTPTETAEALRRKEIVLVDVREPAELRGGRVKGARNIPLGQLASRIGELDRGTTVAFVCQSGMRSGRAARAAAKAGLDTVNVKGGVLAWAGSGLPLIR